MVNGSTIRSGVPVRIKWTICSIRAKHGNFIVQDLVSELYVNSKID